MPTWAVVETYEGGRVLAVELYASRPAAIERVIDIAVACGSLSSHSGGPADRVRAQLVIDDYYLGAGITVTVMRPLPRPSGAPRPVFHPAVGALRRQAPGAGRPA